MTDRVYETDAPAVAVEPVDHGPELLAVHDTATLQRMHDSLRQAIPGDASFLNTVSAILRSLLTREINNPDRQKRDDDAQDRADVAAEDLLKTKQEAEKQALARQALTPEEKAKAEQEALDKKHADEMAALQAQKARDDLAVKQAEERKEFEARQAEERGKIAAAVPASTERGLPDKPFYEQQPPPAQPYPPQGQPYPPSHA